MKPSYYIVRVEGKFGQCFLIEENGYYNLDAFEGAAQFKSIKECRKAIKVACFQRGGDLTPSVCSIFKVSPV